MANQRACPLLLIRLRTRTPRHPMKICILWSENMEIIITQCKDIYNISMFASSFRPSFAPNFTPKLGGLLLSLLREMLRSAALFLPSLRRLGMTWKCLSPKVSSCTIVRVISWKTSDWMELYSDRHEYLI